MSKILIRVVTAVVVVVALVYGGILLYTKVLNPPEEKLGQDDLAAVVDNTTNTPESDLDNLPVVENGVAGNWQATDASTVGYRVKEVLGGVDTEGVGRTNQVVGSLTISGSTVVSTYFEIEVASIKSDSSKRDGQFAGNIMDTATYPTAAFSLVSPIELGSIPADGESVTATAVGELTLHGVTQPVEFEVEAQVDNGIIGVLGSIVIVFSDYGIANPSNGFVTTGDTGLLEFVLAFERA